MILFLADGFEDIEAITVADVLKFVEKLTDINKADKLKDQMMLNLLENSL